MVWGHTSRPPRPLGRWLLLAVACLATSCDPAPAEPEGLHTATIRVGSSASANSSHIGGVASVVAGVTLTTTTSEGSHSEQAPLGTRNPQATFEIAVPPGVVSFHAAVTSNTGVLLYEGSREVIVEQDGFQVEVPLEARAPVLVVTPDSVRATGSGVPPGPALFLLRNEGIGRVQWRVASVSPSLSSCGQSLCLNVSPLSGAISAGVGPTSFVQVGLLSTPERRYRLVLETDQGTVEVVVDAAGAGTLEARVMRSGGFSAPPSPIIGNQVRLRACAGGTAGAPGSCIPNTSVPVTLRATGSDGVARFTGLPAGLWELQPDATGFQFQTMQPARYTVALTGGSLVTVTFQASPIQAPPEGP